MIILISQSVANLAGAVAHSLTIRGYVRHHSICTNVKLKQLAFLNTSSEPTAAKYSSAASWLCSSSCDYSSSVWHHAWLKFSSCWFQVVAVSAFAPVLPAFASSVYQPVFASLLTSRFACCRACLKGPFTHPCSLAWEGSTSGIPTATCLATSYGGRSSWSRKLHSC